MGKEIRWSKGFTSKFTMLSMKTASKAVPYEAIDIESSSQSMMRRMKPLIKKRKIMYMIFPPIYSIVISKVSQLNLLNHSPIGIPFI